MRINPYSHISTQHVHDTLVWDFLDKRYKKHLYIMMYKVLQNLTPNYMLDNISLRSTNYELRSSQVMNLPKPRSNCCKRTFFYRGISVYNQLPIAIRNATSLRSFQTFLDEYIP